MLNQEELKELLHYDPDTGIFTWLKPSQGRRKNRIAGCLNNNGYRVIRINKKLYLAHRLSWLYMTGEFPINEIDHKNMNKNDNRWDNLRKATHSQNQMNSKKYKNCKSGFKGVCWHKRDKKWEASIKKNGIQKHLGYFNTPEEASEVYKKAAKKIHGDFYFEKRKE